MAMTPVLFPVLSLVNTVGAMVGLAVLLGVGSADGNTVGSADGVVVGSFFAEPAEKSPKALEDAVPPKRRQRAPRCGCSDAARPPMPRHIAHTQPTSPEACVPVGAPRFALRFGREIIGPEAHVDGPRGGGPEPAFMQCRTVKSTVLLF